MSLRDGTLKFGKMAFEWQQRIDFDKLRNDRLTRAHKMLHKWGIGAALVFNWDSGRYLSRPFNHPYARHLPSHFVVLCRDAGFPYYPAGEGDKRVIDDSPWLKDRVVGHDVLADPGTIMLRPWEDQKKRWDKTAQQIKALMKNHKVADLPLSVDYASPIAIKALEDAGLKVVDGNAWILEADMIKTDEEIELMKLSATCNERGMSYLVREFMPGMTECDVRALMAKGIYEAGAEYIEGWITESGVRNAPRTFNWSDNVVRPGEFLAIEACHVTYCGYKLCYSRTFLVGAKPTPLQKEIYETGAEMQRRAKKLLKPGMTTHEWAKLRPRPEKPLKTVEDVQKYRLSWSNHFGGMGIRWNGWPQASLDEPDIPLEKNMVMAYAASCAVLGYAGCKIENTYRVTDTGCEALTVWPYDEIPMLGVSAFG
ncbi:MAG: M24 family metallopeptidase [Candidatus Bathyarchaeota archaeon]